MAGFRYALARDYDAIVEMDADFSHNLHDLPRVLAPVHAGQADLARGSRWEAGGGTRNWPWYRKLFSRGGSWYARTILGVPVRDVTGGFKRFHRQVLLALDLNTVHAKGYAFQIELTYRAPRAGLRVREVPSTFTERVHGQSKMSGSIFCEAMGAVWHVRFAAQPTPTLQRKSEVQV